jgi:hypothetical protein
VLGVGDDDLTRIDPDGRHAGFRQRGGNEAAARQLAGSGDGIEHTRGELLQRCQCLHHLGNRCELGPEIARDLGLSRSTRDARSDGKVALRQRIQPFDGLIAFTGFHGSSDLQQAVSDLRQRGDNDDRRTGLAALTFDLAPDDRDDSPERIFVGNGRAAELHDHAHDCWLANRDEPQRSQRSLSQGQCQSFVFLVTFVVPVFQARVNLTASLPVTSAPRSESPHRRRRESCCGRGR